MAQEAIKGLIVSHDNQTIVVRAGDKDTPISLTPTTRIRGTSGVLGVRGDDAPPTSLIRGLAVEVTTAAGSSGLTASEVIFKNSDLATAQRINAGIASTDERVNANAAGIATNAAGIANNSARIDNVGEFNAAGRTKVYFASGSSHLTDAGKKDLLALAEQAKGITGYRLAVVGRADPTGNADANQRLSEARAKTVTNFLLENGGVLPGRFLPSVAVGESPVVQDVDPPGSNDEARRVTVTIAVSKSAQPAP